MRSVYNSDSEIAKRFSEINQQNQAHSSFPVKVAVASVVNVEEHLNILCKEGIYGCCMDGNFTLSTKSRA